MHTLIQAFSGFSSRQLLFCFPVTSLCERIFVMRKALMMLVAVAALAVGLSACKPQEEVADPAGNADDNVETEVTE